MQRPIMFWPCCTAFGALRNKAIVIHAIQGEWIDWQAMLVLQRFGCESEEVGQICSLCSPQKAPRWIRSRSTSLSDQSQQALIPSTCFFWLRRHFVMLMFTSWHPHHEVTFSLNRASHHLLFEARFFCRHQARAFQKFLFLFCPDSSSSMSLLQQHCFRYSSVSNCIKLLTTITNNDVLLNQVQPLD